RRPLHEVHRDVEQVVLAPEVERRDDPRMVEHGRRLRLVEKHQRLVREELAGGQDLDRAQALEAALGGAPGARPDLAHPAFAELEEQLVLPDLHPGPELLGHGPDMMSPVHGKRNARILCTPAAMWWWV